MTWVYVALGGAAGALVRHAVALGVGPHRLGGLPWATFAVNAVGSLLLGLVLAALPAGRDLPTRALLATGFCGALTTFSTFGYETLALLQARAFGAAAAYVAASLATGVAAVALGLWAGSRLGG